MLAGMELSLDKCSFKPTKDVWDKHPEIVCGTDWVCWNVLRLSKAGICAADRCKLVALSLEMASGYAGVLKQLSDIQQGLQGQRSFFNIKGIWFINKNKTKWSFCATCGSGALGLGQRAIQKLVGNQGEGLLGKLMYESLLRILLF